MFLHQHFQSEDFDCTKEFAFRKSVQRQSRDSAETVQIQCRDSPETVQIQSRDMFVLVCKSLRTTDQPTKQPPDYSAFQISFVGQKGQGKSGDWQLINVCSPRLHITKKKVYRYRGDSPGHCENVCQLIADT